MCQITTVSNDSSLEEAFGVNVVVDRSAIATNDSFIADGCVEVEYYRYLHDSDDIHFNKWHCALHEKTASSNLDSALSEADAWLKDHFGTVLIKTA